MLTAKEQQLLDALEPRAQSVGIEIVTVEVVGAKKSPTIRVYIDTPDGVGFDDLSKSQAWIGDAIDELDPFPGAYVLEVSSPGIDRPLRTLDHYRRYAGETVVIETVKPLEGRRKWTGELLGVDDDVLLKVNGAVARIALDNIKRATVKGTVDFNR